MEYWQENEKNIEFPLDNMKNWWKIGEKLMKIEKNAKASIE